jgi:hypothetical protein
LFGKQWKSEKMPAFTSPTRHKNVILSGARHRFIAWHSACSAESKDPGGAYLTYAAQTFSTTEARTGRVRTVFPWGWKMITVDEKIYP